MVFLPLVNSKFHMLEPREHVDNEYLSIVAHLFSITVPFFFLLLTYQLKKLPKSCCRKGEENRDKNIHKLENPLKTTEISK